MADIDFTPEQLSAIKTECRNLLVSAAAGSGKTRVLVERIIRKISDPDNDIDIDRLLVVTFTNAAASEMSARIRKALTAAIARGDAPPKLYRQIGLINNASIMTVHAFCLEVIRNNFHVIDIDPGFRIADETEISLVKNEAMTGLFEEIYEAPDVDGAFRDLTLWYGSGNDDRQLQQILLGIYDDIQSHPYPFKWLRDNVDAFDASGPGAVDIFLDRVIFDLKECAADMEDALRIIGTDEGLNSYGKNFGEERDAILKAIETLETPGFGWDGLKGILSGIEFSKLSKAGKNTDQSRKTAVTDLRERTKKKIDYLCEAFGVFALRDIERDRKRLHEIFSCMRGLLERFEAIFRELKRERGILDFNDIEHYCLEILTGESGVKAGIPEAYRQRFKEVLVDEYQDTNLTQEAIFSAIGGKMFMVGDIKQSIYRFRNSNPDIFAAKYDRYADAGEDGADDRKVLLNKNFRSSSEIIDIVNRIFRKLMSREAGELDYTEKEELNFGAVKIAAGNPVELYVLDKEGINSELEDEADNASIESTFIAEKIRQLREADPSLKYRDIMVLLRSTQNTSDTYRKKFEEAGIPVYIDNTSGLFASVEVQNVLCLLQIIDNSLQDIPLLAVMRSPVGGFKTAEIAAVRAGAEFVQGENFYRALEKMADDTELGAKVADFLGKLSGWRKLAMRLPTHELIWQLYSETFYYDYAGALPNGGRRQANLKLLYEKAAEFESTTYKGLFNFNNFISRLEQSKGDVGPAVMLSESDDVVRIMSIHKSKGLEFKVVFAAGCGKGFNKQDTREKILIHRDHGFGPEMFDIRRGLRYQSIYKSFIKSKINAESMSEELRVLYVALTRAQEKLIITGVQKNFKSNSQKWKLKCTPGRVLGATCALDWLCGALYDHPDAAVLRGEYEEGANGAGGGGQLLTVRIVDTPHFMQKAEEEAEKEFKLPEAKQGACGDDFKDAIARLDWKYPFEGASKLPIKITVSEYNKRFVEDDTRHDIEVFGGDRAPVQIVKAPAFISGGAQAKAAQIGTLTHHVLQVIPLGPQCADAGYVAAFIAELAAKGLMSAAEAAAIDEGDIAAFFASEIGRRMINAPRVYRELAFNLAIEAGELLELRTANPDEKILVQGVIDCYYVDAAGSVLLDYKTDSVRDFDEDKFRRMYGGQINLYRRALTERYGTAPDTTCIYMLRNRKFIYFDR